MSDEEFNPSKLSWQGTTVDGAPMVRLETNSVVVLLPRDVARKFGVWLVNWVSEHPSG